MGEADLTSLEPPPSLSTLLEQTMQSPVDFEAQQSADLADNRWLSVDGWRLARVDARLCAITALLEV